MIAKNESVPRRLAESEARMILTELDPALDNASDALFIAASREDAQGMIVALRRIASLGDVARGAYLRLEGRASQRMH